MNILTMEFESESESECVYVNANEPLLLTSNDVHKFHCNNTTRIR